MSELARHENHAIMFVSFQGSLLGLLKFVHDSLVFNAMSNILFIFRVLKITILNEIQPKTIGNSTCSSDLAY